MDSCPVEAYRKVSMARRLVTSSITSRDYDVILVTSQSSKVVAFRNKSCTQTDTQTDTLSTDNKGHLKLNCTSQYIKNFGVNCQHTLWQ